MQFTCDRCHSDYEATARNAVAHLFLKDSRCNHIETHCTECGNKEVIFLGARQITAIIRDEQVPPTVDPDASAQLRVRAEKAWAAAEDKEPSPEADSLGPAATPRHGGQAGTAEVLQRYELTRRHEDLLDTFGETLTNIPDDLLWDELRGDHDRKHPDRWVD
jgi:hypothetical protein